MAHVCAVSLIEVVCYLNSQLLRSLVEYIQFSFSYLLSPFHIGCQDLVQLLIRLTIISMKQAAVALLTF